MAQDYYGEHTVDFSNRDTKSEKEKRKKRFDKAEQELRQKTRNETLELNLEGFNLPNINVANVGEVMERASYYFLRCSQSDLPPTVAGLASWIGISRDTWLKWVDGDAPNKDVRELSRKIMALLDAEIEARLIIGKINPAGAIFLQKNNFGYSDDGRKAKPEAVDPNARKLGVQDILKLIEKDT